MSKDREPGDFRDAVGWAILILAIAMASFVINKCEIERARAVQEGVLVK